MKKIAFYTLGCKVNQYETDAVSLQFQDKGYEVVSFTEFADIYIVNTCTVTNIADKKSRQILNKAKKINENAIIVAIGCYVQVSKDELEKDSNIDLLIGNNNKSDVINIVENYINQSEDREHVINLSEQKEYEEFQLSSVKEKTRVFIKIQDGCNQFCSYCIIPYTRGRIRSRAPENVIKEVNEIVNNGYKEVVLTGIHLASYGKDLEDYSLIDLLEVLDKIEGLERIRLGSVEPNLITKDFVDRLSRLNHICPHFHLSLQSGCDATLKRMNRKYDTNRYREAVNILRNCYKNPSITTDIIVGFPMETEEEFEETKAFVREIKFADIHVFKYSIRKGTVAGDMSGQIPMEVKNKRSQALIRVKNELFDQYCKGFIGQEVEVLFETQQIIDGEAFIVGHTPNYLKVAAKEEGNCEDMTGKIMGVKISNYHNNLLIGKYY